ncbi:MAG: hypothetical protein M1829_003545 [Trizodia sp. TS-e1964]|nr:MAG: hypothetical protein M1829_003545 [Trizodia sp. TS-e1964]
MALAPGAPPVPGLAHTGIHYPILSFDKGEPSIGAVDTMAMKERERQAVEKELLKEARQGKGVGIEGQEIFDALVRTLPTRWHGTTIIVLDSIVITPPFGVNNCHALSSKDATSLPRVKKVVRITDP